MNKCKIIVTYISIIVCMLAVTFFVSTVLAASTQTVEYNTTIKYEVRRFNHTFVNNKNLIGRGDLSTEDAIGSYMCTIYNENLIFNSDGYYTINYDVVSGRETIISGLSNTEYAPSTDYLFSMDIKVDSYNAGSGGYAKSGVLVQTPGNNYFGEEYFNASEYTIGSWVNISKIITSPNLSIGTGKLFLFVIEVQNWTGTFSVKNLSLSKLTDTQTVETQSGESLGTLPTCSMFGHTFGGWFTQPVGGTQITASTVPTGPSTYYAHWTANSYNITYDLNGGTHGANHPSSYIYSCSTHSRNLSAPSRSGYVFSNWTVNPSGSATATGDLMIYGTTAEDIELTANWKKLATITFNNTSATYTGSEFDLSSPSYYTISGLLSGDVVSSVSYTSSTNVVGVGSYTITPDGVTGITVSNYRFTCTSGTFTVTKANLTVTKTGGSATYTSAEIDVPAGFTTSGLLGSDSVTSISYSPTTVTSVGDHAITPSAAVGTGLDNYNISYAAGTFTVNKASLTVTKTNGSATYTGSAITVPDTFTTSGLLGSDSVTSISCSPATVTNAGDHTITPSVAVGTGLDKYTINYVPGTFTVNKVSLTITKSNGSAPYTGSSITVPGTFTTSGLLGSDSVTSISCSPATVVNLGDHTITPSAAVGTGLGNYNISYADGTFTVNRAVLTITKTGGSATYTGSEISVSSTFTTSGLLSGDSVTSISYSPATVTNAGDHTITPSAAVGTGLDKYTINYVSGTFTVNKASLTIKKTGGSATYTGSAISVPSTFTTNGLKSGDSVSSISYSPTSVTSIGSHTITISSASGSGLGNYNIIYASGTFTVSKLSFVKPALTSTSFTYSGSSRSVSLDSDYNSTYMGTYGDSSGTDADSYTLYVYLRDTTGTQWSDGTTSDLALNWSISRASLTITKSGGSATYTGSAISVPSGFSTSGLKSGDSVSSISYSPTSVTNAGSYTVSASSASGSGLSNYNISYSSGTFTVGKMTLTKPALTNTSLAYTGATRYVALNSDYNKTYMYYGGTASASEVGSYTLSVYLRSTSNTQWSGGSTSTLSLGWSITKVSLTIKFTNRSVSYTGSTISVSSSSYYTITGLKSGDSVSSVSYSSSPSTIRYVATYTVSPSSASGTGLSNYNISYSSGTLTVSAVAKSVSLNIGTGLSMSVNGSTYYSSTSVTLYWDYTYTFSATIRISGTSGRIDWFGSCGNYIDETSISYTVGSSSSQSIGAEIYNG